MSDGAREATNTEAAAPPATTSVERLDELVGAQPDALESLYRVGSPADPSALGDAPRGRFLAIPAVVSAHLAAGPLVRAFASDHFPWRGKTFDHGGNSGQNVFFGRTMFRFRAERAESRVDGAPTLAFKYDAEAHRNPWLVRALVGELRAIGDGIAIGPLFFRDALVAWYGLAR